MKHIANDLVASYLLEWELTDERDKALEQLKTLDDAGQFINGGKPSAVAIALLWITNDKSYDVHIRRFENKFKISVSAQTVRRHVKKIGDLLEKMQCKKLQ